MVLVCVADCACGTSPVAVGRPVSSRPLRVVCVFVAGLFASPTGNGECKCPEQESALPAWQVERIVHLFCASTPDADVLALR